MRKSLKCTNRTKGSLRAELQTVDFGRIYTAARGSRRDFCARQSTTGINTFFSLDNAFAAIGSICAHSAVDRLGGGALVDACRPIAWSGVQKAS